MTCQKKFNVIFWETSYNDFNIYLMEESHKKNQIKKKSESKSAYGRTLVRFTVAL